MGLTITDLTAGYRSLPVLHGLELTVSRGQLVCVLGSSGSGKTTLLRVIAGLQPLGAGVIRLDGRQIQDQLPESRGIGFVPQEGALFTHLSVAQNVAFGLAGRPRTERRARTSALLELVGLGALAHRMPHQLSGGQQQRVALARALAREPDLVLLDEPFSALDASLRSELRAQLRAVLAETGTTALLVTHDRDEALSIADQLALIDAGRIQQLGRPEEVYLRPATAWVGRFIGDSVVLRGDSDGRTAATLLGPVPHHPHPAGSVEILLRPEQLMVGPGNSTAGAAAEVVSVRYAGPHSVLTLRLSDGTQVTARTSSIPQFESDSITQSPFGRGDRVQVTVRGLASAFDAGTETRQLQK